MADSDDGKTTSATLEVNPPQIRHPSATNKPHGTGLSATSATSATREAGESTKPGPLADIETINQVGRDLGPELERRVRKIMAPMSRKDRAELAAALDDAFEVASSVEAARWQCHRLLSDAKTLAAAKAVWPAYPEPPAPIGSAAPAAGRVEPVAPWLAHIARHCELVLDDRRYLLDHLAARSHAEAMRLAHRYVEAWAAGAAAEPIPHRRANAGRRAANTFLRGADQ